MEKIKSVRGPTLDNYGQYFVQFGEDGQFRNDNPSEQLLTGNMAIGAVAIPITNTSGFAVGQTVQIKDSLATERRVVTAVTPGVSLGIAASTNAYATARGATVTVVSIAESTTRVKSVMTNPFTAGLSFGQSWIASNSLRIYGTLSGAFTQGELCTGTGGATGRLINQGATWIEVCPIQGTFLLADTVTGGTSGRTVTAITSFTPGPPTVVVTTQKVDINAGALRWRVAVTADVAGMESSVSADLD